MSYMYMTAEAHLLADNMPAPHVYWHALLDLLTWTHDATRSVIKTPGNDVEAQ